MRKVWVVVKDETDYGGERTCPRVFTDEDAAVAYAKYELEKAVDWTQSMREGGERVADWIPSFTVHPSDLQE